ncbi:AAA family ATPase [Halocella sp. SP3-1]|uniref:AAA family ATPase n=1 Tax=Halocella sp. SP3-1 TaxID=2382161 RepID=UPI000F759BA3|nr:AAA family ATPase [Halocella sp. SP3-1]AZO93841.1 AAA family ATPase [Halocella sp. SP3-1]
MRRFNVTTTCVKHLHYMADISKKLYKIIKMIETGYYFTINRARQKGKTTILKLLAKELSDKYLVVSTSFEGSSYLFEDDKVFSQNIFHVFAEPFELFQPEIAEKIKSYGHDLKNLNDVSKAISRWCYESEKEILLLIDEVDKASNYYVFMDFLGLLRKKYIAQQSNEDVTFKSVILAGVSDIKRIKTHIAERRIITEAEAKNLSKSQYNSPWNVAETFKVDLDFDQEEIESLLLDYLSEHQEIEMDTKTIAEKLHKYTSGYPYLVSKICKLIAEELDEDFSEKGIEEAVNILLDESNTLFDDLIKNVENNEELYNTIYSLIIENETTQYNVHAYNQGIMHSIFKNDNGRLAIHNKIFELILYNYMIAKKHKEEVGKKLSNYTARGLYENENGTLDIKIALLKYQEYMQSVYGKFDKGFIERQGRLLLLAFFKPIINGRGFYFVESQTGFEQRQDVVITFNNHKYIIELKVWRGDKYHQKGIKQLNGYLELENADQGYLVIYDKNDNKEYRSEDIRVDNKDIFAVWV